MPHLKIALLQEGKTPADERVAFTPEQCLLLMKSYPCEVFVQRSHARRIKDEDYAAVGITLVDDVSDCDVLFGIKEVPKDQLLSGKTYVFFSHTIKKQPHNQKLIQKVLEHKVKLVDYECMTNEKGFRLLGFGKYAGIVGTYNGLRMIGKKKRLFDLQKAHDCADQNELHRELKKVKLPAMKICLTGMGRVASEALEILKELNIKQVDVNAFLNESFNEAVFTQLDVTDYNRRKDGTKGEMMEFFREPEKYVSDFQRFYNVSDFYITCHFWDPRSPFIFTKEQMKSDDFKIRFVSDISCDIPGPVASTIRTSTIKDPFYGVDRMTGLETDFNNSEAIAVMAVDNLPCELPVNASRDFGEQLIQQVIPSFFNGDKDGILNRATIAENGELTEKFSYLKDYASGK